MLAMGNFLHNVHVSVTNFDVNTLTKKIRYSIKLFKDDLTDLIYQCYSIILIIKNNKERNKVRIWLYYPEIQSGIQIKRINTGTR